MNKRNLFPLFLALMLSIGALAQSDDNDSEKAKPVKIVQNSKLHKIQLSIGVNNSELVGSGLAVQLRGFQIIKFTKITTLEPVLSFESFGKSNFQGAGIAFIQTVPGYEGELCQIPIIFQVGYLNQEIGEMKKPYEGVGYAVEMSPDLNFQLKNTGIGLSAGPKVFFGGETQIIWQGKLVLGIY